MDEMYHELKSIFEQANQKLITEDVELFEYDVNERTLCGALKSHLEKIISTSKYSMYHVDVEYNRNRNGTVKTCCKFYDNGFPVPVKINCDLIVHSRGIIISQDNLIAIEMKKSTRPQESKDEDKIRLCALTSDSYDGVWSFDGKTLPEHVCRYKLGVYYEINIAKRRTTLMYFYKGYIVENHIIPY